MSLPSINTGLHPLIEDDDQLDALKEKIQRERGFNCVHYKDKCLRRRIAVRMRARGQNTYGGYSALLDQDATEYEMLLDALTINVTKFFRNADTWKTISETLLPRLFNDRRALTRIWSAGCSSGEEPYSIAILLHRWAEENGRLEDLRHFRIIGTDIDRRSLESARRAEYLDLSLTETPDDVRERWFSPGSPFRLRSEARRYVSFLHHDLISDEAERDYSLIMCRNVIIYFDREIQEKLFQRFYDSLRPGGYLVLGKVETLLGRTRTLFQAVSNRERIFQKPV
ncbi:MAG TPA: protein-glutamate O-methyltransferase CheR [Longimicrobiaceae bacterium]|nr:protein-glutamate O-methyltransferase CheR [Longimicrobiaceae bacterium]